MQTSNEFFDSNKDDYYETVGGNGPMARTSDFPAFVSSSPFKHAESDENHNGDMASTDASLIGK